MNVMYVEFQCGGYYEPTISIEYNVKDYDGWEEARALKIETRDDLLNMFKFWYSEYEFSKNMKELTLSYYNNVIRNISVFQQHQVDNVIKNLNWLLDIRNKSYTYNLHNQYLEKVFNCSDGFGSFRQSVVPFEDWNLLFFNTHDIFVKKIEKKIPEKIFKLSYIGNEEQKIAELKSNVNWCDENILRIKKEIKNYQKTKRKAVKEIKTLEEGG